MSSSYEALEAGRSCELGRTKLDSMRNLQAFGGVSGFSLFPNMVLAISRPSYKYWPFLLAMILLKGIVEKSEHQS